LLTTPLTKIGQQLDNPAATPNHKAKAEPLDNQWKQQYHQEHQGQLIVDN
jgi:hypothetical protein